MRSRLNSWAVKIRRTLLTSVSLGFIKAVSIATSFLQDTEMLHFILFFNGKAESQIIIFFLYPIYPLPSNRSNHIQMIYGHERWLRI